MDVLNKWGEEMSRYIDIEDVANAIYHHFPSVRTMADARSVIEEAPTIDAVSVVHGEWIFKTVFPNDKSEFPMGYLVCSVCGSHHSNSTPCNYCDNCGAKMKGADDEVR